MAAEQSAAGKAIAEALMELETTEPLEISAHVVVYGAEEEFKIQMNQIF